MVGTHQFYYNFIIKIYQLNFLMLNLTLKNAIDKFYNIPLQKFKTTLMTTFQNAMTK